LKSNFELTAPPHQHGDVVGTRRPGRRRSRSRRRSFFTPPFSIRRSKDTSDRAPMQHHSMCCAVRACWQLGTNTVFGVRCIYIEFAIFVMYSSWRLIQAATRVELKQIRIF
jgi:hypothetical protein